MVHNRTIQSTCAHQRRAQHDTALRWSPPLWHSRYHFLSHHSLCYFQHLDLREQMAHSRKSSHCNVSIHFACSGSCSILDDVWLTTKYSTQASARSSHHCGGSRRLKYPISRQTPSPRSMIFLPLVQRLLKTSLGIWTRQPHFLLKTSAIGAFR